MHELHEPGSWRCFQCLHVNLGSITNCPHYMKVERANSKFGSKKFVLCKGSQATTFGGYVSVHEQKPLIMSRHVNPHWRGKFGSGQHAWRAQARDQSITETEESQWVMGGDQENKKRTAEVSAIMLSRQKVKDTRARKKERKREAFAKDLIDNPGTWPCGYCVDDHRNDPTTPDTHIHNT